MTRRVRLSTVLLTVIFAGLLVLYVEVRPPPVSVNGTVEPSTAPTPAPTRVAPRTAEPTPEPTAEPTSTPATPGAPSSLLTPSAVPESGAPSTGGDARHRGTPETTPTPTADGTP